jgi:hypothetical protein
LEKKAMIKMIIPLAILLAIPNAVNADEPYAGYEQDRARAERSQSSYIKKVAWMSSCGPKITPAVCRRIKRDDAELRRGPRREKIYAAETRRDRDYADRETRDRDYSRRDDGVERCVGQRYTFEGAKNVVRRVAEFNAREAWRRKVRSKHGTQFADTDNASQDKMRCWDEGIFVRCEYTARACRA